MTTPTLVCSSAVPDLRFIICEGDVRDFKPPAPPALAVELALLGEVPALLDVLRGEFTANGRHPVQFVRLVMCPQRPRAVIAQDLLQGSGVGEEGIGDGQ